MSHTMSFGWADIPCQGDIMDESAFVDHCLGSDPISSTWMDPQPQPITRTPKPTQSLKRKLSSVTFSPLAEIRTYDIVLGDHPFCRGGMALQCGWQYGETQVCELESLIANKRHRSAKQLCLDLAERRQRLLDFTGLSDTELLMIEYRQISGRDIESLEQLLSCHHSTS